MVELEENKILTRDSPIQKLPQPKQVYIPLSQHTGRATSPVVKVGDEVFYGQRIADSSAAISSPIHASVSGKVTAISDWPHPTVGVCKAIIIENDRKDYRPVSRYRLAEEIERLTSDEIRQIVRQAGIVGMGGAGFPTHVKLTPPKPVDTFILNGAECEPYLTCDYRLMIEKTAEILKGVELIVRCVGIKQVFIAIEDNKPEAIKAFREGIRDTGYGIRVLKTSYPQGGEKQLIKNILKREVPSGKLPFDVGVLVHNVGTALAIYEAVYENKPLCERVVTVTGDCIRNPKNLLVRIGTPIKELIEFCGPLKGLPSKIIVGGPMMGIAQFTDMAPIIKTTTGIILMNEEKSTIGEEEFCIRCGSCVRACPVGLMPCLINGLSEKGLWQEAKEYGVSDCIECGLCSFVCPANRRLVQSIRRAKIEILR